jgi:hypothetical protein
LILNLKPKTLYKRNGNQPFRISSRPPAVGRSLRRAQVTVIVAKPFRAGSLRFLFLWIETRCTFPRGSAFLSPRPVVPGSVLHRLSALRWEPPCFLRLSALPVRAGLLFCLCLAVSALFPSWDFSQPFIARLMKQMYTRSNSQCKDFLFLIHTNNSQTLLTIVNNPENVKIDIYY